MERDDQLTPRRFRIWIDGTLSPGFVNGLDGVDQHDAEGGTILAGDYVDESHLEGVLDHLRGLAIRVRRFEVDPAPEPTTTKEGLR